MSYRSGEDEFYTPTGTIAPSIDNSLANDDSNCLESRFSLGTGDLSLDVMNVLSERRMTVDNATIMGIVDDIERAQYNFRYYILKNTHSLFT